MKAYFDRTALVAFGIAAILGGLSAVLAVKRSFHDEESPASPSSSVKPSIRMLIGFEAGGGTDIIARMIAMEMQKTLGQPVVCINRPGGGGLVSWRELVASPPDGLTIAIFLPLNASIQKHLRTSMTWVDPVEDIRFLGMVNRDPWGVAVRADAPFHDINGFVEWIRAHPRAKLGDGGPATAYHWAFEDMMDRFGFRNKTVTYRGATASSLLAVAGGEVVAAGAGPSEADSMVRAGLVKMIAIAADERNPVYADIPTFREQGFDFTFGPARGFAAPAGTPDDQVQMLAEAIKRAYESESFQDYLKTSGQGGWYLSPQDGEAFIKETDAKFHDLIQKAGLARE